MINCILSRDNLRENVLFYYRGLGHRPFPLEVQSALHVLDEVPRTIFTFWSKFNEI